MADVAVGARMDGPPAGRQHRWRLLGRAARLSFAVAAFIVLVVLAAGLHGFGHVGQQSVDTVAGTLAESIAFAVYLSLTWALFRFAPTQQLQAQAGMRRGPVRAAAWMLLAIALVFGEVYDAVVTLPHIQTDAPDAAGLARILVAANIFMSWLVLHAVYAELYAAKYYRDGGGLRFPGTDTPDYRDFAYSIGMTFGTTDVEAGPSFRRMMLPHKLFTFAFNTAILALVVNSLPG
ncbi:DUF1345 domain-containing protein [Dactylosporangium roseum]|uniref:DUF1345 domain-containing protein n=1 Tax=Dactylosporangium roseum TaxID=47989 RepID=A0ABY5ZCT7_9ACTN|nr:DUF1345 domain-containing protein [Dactylosporangium roseum]UWZ39469.1 DUF1345 domain-containing protein [Dactylosporangium roseum]